MSSAKEVLSHLKITWYGLLVVLAVLLIVLSAANSTSLSAISIKLRPGQEEHRDKTIPFVTKPGEELPDYRAAYLLGGHWHTVGTAFNSSATNWLEFRISDPPNLTLVQGIRISDEDVVEHDHLEEVQLVDRVLSGQVFEYRIETKKSFEAGMTWFSVGPAAVPSRNTIKPRKATFLVRGQFRSRTIGCSKNDRYGCPPRPLGCRVAFLDDASAIRILDGDHARTQDSPVLRLALLAGIC